MRRHPPGSTLSPYTTLFRSVEDGLGPERLAYLRGDRSRESAASNPFRERASVLGDIVNSNPAFAGDENFGFYLLPGSEGNSYRNFIRNTTSKRPKMIYVGANDGMLQIGRAPC